MNSQNWLVNEHFPVIWVDISRFPERVSQKTLRASSLSKRFRSPLPSTELGRFALKVGAAMSGLVVVLVLLNDTSDSADRPTAPLPSDDPVIQRGEYLVHSVAMCVACHSPRDESGKLVRNRTLSGAPIPVPSPYRSQTWATQAPRIAGLPGRDERDVIKLLQEGHTADGFEPRPPMPQFRMTKEDAVAVVRYLKTQPAFHAKSDRQPIETSAN